MRLSGLDGETRKEVVLWRAGVLHIYLHEEYGRQTHRRLVYVSDVRAWGEKLPSCSRCTALPSGHGHGHGRSMISVACGDLRSRQRPSPRR